MEIISRNEAKQRDMKYYFTGKPCVKGMVAVRRVSTGQCQCELHLAQYDTISENYKKNNEKHVKEKLKQYREIHREKRLKQIKDWHAKNKEHVRVKQNERRINNREKIRDYDRKWYYKHQEKRVESCKKYRTKNEDVLKVRKNSNRSRNTESIAPWFDEFDEMVSIEAYSLALKRSKETGFKWDVDHIAPLKSRRCSGLHCATNLRVIPSSINRFKNNRLVLQGRLDWIYC